MDETLFDLPGYKSLRVIAKALIVIMACVVMLDLGAIVSDMAELDLVDRVMGGETVTYSEAIANDDRQQSIATFQLAALVVAGIFFIIWFFRARKNVEAFGALDLRYGPGWAIGAWFIPIASLFIPKMIVDDVWRASDPSLPASDRSTWKSSRVWPIIHIWWIVWIASSLVGFYVIRADRVTLDQLRSVASANIWADAGSALAGVLGIAIVAKLSARQEERARAIATSGRTPVPVGASAPPPII